MQRRGTVLLVDEDLEVLESVGELLQPHGYSVRTFSTAASLMRERLPSTPCCAIIDAEMAEDGVPRLQRWLAKARPGTPVIQLTEHGNIPQAVQAIREGATDFLTKPIDQVGMIYAVQRAFAEEERLRPECEERAFCERQFATLTAREREVCALVVAGKLNKQIAAELGTCEKTVKVHRGRVMKKMNVQSVAGLVRMVVKMGTVTGATGENHCRREEVQTKPSDKPKPQPSHTIQVSHVMTARSSAHEVPPGCGVLTGTLPGLTGQ